MNQSIFPARLLALLLLLAALSGCGPSAQAPTPTPAVAPTDAPAATAAPTDVATATAAPSDAPTATAAFTEAPTPAAASHSAGDARPTRTPVATPTSGVLLAFYACDTSFCSAELNGSAARKVFANAPQPDTLNSYAFSPDGKQLVYALDKPGAAGSATLYLLGADDAQPRALFDLSGSESGNGGIEGYGVLGFARDGNGLIFEDQAQVFVAALDGSNRRPLLEQRPYGASSTHTYTLAPDASRVLVVSSNEPYYFEVANVAGDAVLSYTVDYDRSPVAFGVSADQVVVEHFDPPVDQTDGNPAAKSYMTLGYELLDLPQVSSIDTALQPGKLAYRDDGSGSRSVASNVVAGQLLLRDDEHKEGDAIVEAPHALSLLDLNAGTRTPIILSDYPLQGQQRVWLVAR